MPLLSLKAGATAYRHIQQNGLEPSHISSIFAASGAAKWLAIYGLDKVIFNDWLTPLGQPENLHTVRLFGTSVGAFKLAAACHRNSAQGLDDLAQAYWQQNYPNGITPAEIEREFVHLRQAVLAGDHMNDILNHPYLHLSFAAVRCHGQLASDAPAQQRRACVKAALRNIIGRQALQDCVDRVVFHDPRVPFHIAGLDGYTTYGVALNTENFAAAITASGSIPVYMYGIENIPGAPEGVYRDGGLLDYHPVPGNFWQHSGIVLYPHFYSACTMGWLDKALPWRRAPKASMTHTVLLSPSEDFFARTRLGRPPDRQDFKRFANQDALRKELWREVMDLSHELGEEFLNLARSGDWCRYLRPL